MIYFQSDVFKMPILCKYSESVLEQVLDKNKNKICLYEFWDELLSINRSFENVDNYFIATKVNGSLVPFGCLLEDPLFLINDIDVCTEGAMFLSQQGKEAVSDMRSAPYESIVYVTESGSYAPLRVLHRSICEALSHIELNNYKGI